MSTPLCQNCGEQPATVFITKVINDETSRQQLCEACAREKAIGEGWLSHLTEQLGEDGIEFGDQFKEALAEMPLDDIMMSLFDGVNFEGEETDEEDSDDDLLLPGRDEEFLPAVPLRELSRRCPSCGTTWDRLKQDGRAGCYACYASFRSELDEVMNRLQRGAQHAGKAPRAAEKRRRRLEHLRQRRDHQLEMLRNRLKDAVACEHYEEAAKLRDRIKIVSSTIVSD